jgi:hypothetical protein
MRKYNWLAIVALLFGLAVMISMVFELVTASIVLFAIFIVILYVSSSSPEDLTLKKFLRFALLLGFAELIVLASFVIANRQAILESLFGVRYRLVIYVALMIPVLIYHLRSKGKR